MEGLEFKLEDEDQKEFLEYSLQNDCDYYLESGDNKKQYAIVSARSWVPSFMVFLLLVLVL
jgi:hypothetical protein|nr:MAG TPA: hypothetical protein [Caudoviricetes sp.]